MQWTKTNPNTEPLLENKDKTTSTEDVEELPLRRTIKKNMNVPRKKLMRCIKLVAAISLLSSVIIIVRVHFFNQRIRFPFFSSNYYIGDTVRLIWEDKNLIIKDKFSEKNLKVSFYGEIININARPQMDSCYKIFQLHESQGNKENFKTISTDPYKKSICLKWNNTTLVVNDTRSERSTCYSVNWETRNESSTLLNCFSLSGAHWYGGSLLANQQWPLQDNSFEMQPYISSPLGVFHTKTSEDGTIGPVLDRIWFNSAGFAVIADADEPLHVSLNGQNREKQLCLKSQDKDSLYINTSPCGIRSLKYTVCVDKTAPLIHRTIMTDFIKLPAAGLDEYLLKSPLWSMRGINMKNLTQMQVFTKQLEISKHPFTHSKFHIGGNYTQIVGSLYFDHERFPNSHQMVSEITDQGFNVSTSVLPVLERGAFPFEFDDGAKAGVFVNITEALNKSQGANVLKVHWGEKTAALVDFTNPRAVEWMTKRLKDLKSAAPVHSFHFDGGEAAWLTLSRETHVPLGNPCHYSTFYVKFAHLIGTDSIVGVGYRSQQYGLMVDIGARSSSWDYDLGLKSVIPSVLTVGLLGYPFALVGPVGGVPVEKFDIKMNMFVLPEEELYIRWLQLSVFLPGIEMSVGPWQYSSKVSTIALALFQRRAAEIIPLFQTAVKEFLQTGAPLVRPVWWLAPDDEVAQRIDCEFLVGSKLLVAPVLDPGATERSVYLPRIKGSRWRDNLRGDVYEGGRWHHGYRVELHEVATFTPVAEPSERSI